MVKQVTKAVDPRGDRDGVLTVWVLVQAVATIEEPRPGGRRIEVCLAVALAWLAFDLLGASRLSNLVP